MKQRKSRKLAAEALESRLVLSSAPGLALGADWEQVIVTLRDDVDDIRGMAGQLVGSNCGDLGHVYEHALKGFSARLPAPALAALARHPKVASIESDLIMQVTAQTTPTGVNRIDADQSGVAKIDGINDSMDVDIAILDTGVGPHSDLNIAGGVSFVGGGYADGNGHGTHVAGIAAALDNGVGVVGVAPGARIWSVRVLDSRGNGYVSNIIKGIDWVTANAATIEIANMSLGGQGKSDAYRAAIQRSVDAGVVYFVSAGNSWADIHGSDEVFNTNDDYVPAAYPEVATISAFADSDGIPGGKGNATSYGSYGLDDGWWHYSNKSNGLSATNPNTEFVNAMNAYGISSPGFGVDLVLPGVDIYSTYKGGGYAKMSGTSMAAPHAAGLAALYIVANGRATNATQVYAIRQALINGGKGWYSAEGLYHTWGPDNYVENVGWAGNIQPKPATAPTVTAITVEPSTLSGDVSIVEGAVTLTAVVDQNAGTNIATVEFSVGNSLIVDENGDDGWSVQWNTLLVPDGQYSVTATATNSSDESGSRTITVEVHNAVDQSMTLSLSGAATLSVNKKNWTATVTAKVSDAVSSTGLAGAVVTGYWGADSSKTVSATTDGTGKATFKSASLSTKTTSIKFTVTSVVLDGYTLDSPGSITVFLNNDLNRSTSGSGASLAAWLASEQDRREKAKSGPEQAVDFLMALGLD